MVRYFFKELDRTRATRKLRNNYFVSSTKLYVFTFGDFNNHESLVKENVITPYPGNIVELKRPVNDKTCKVILRNSTGLSS